MSQYDASKQNYQEVTIFDRPALFTECRIDRATVPEGVYRYELRHGDEDWGEPIELSRSLMVNFYGTVLTREPFQLPIDGWIPMENDSLSFQDGGCHTLAEFQQKYPASDKEVIDFYSVNEPALHALYFSRSEEQDKSAGCVGHLRGDFGSGKQFYTTWWPHQQDALNTPEFKADIDRNALVLGKAAESNNLIQEKYITVSAEKKSVEEARAFFSHVGTDLTTGLSRMSSSVREITVNDRLRLLHDFYRPGEEQLFRFNLEDTIRKGHDFRDCIAPDCISFQKNHYELGNHVGRTLFLREYASFISDAMITELMDYPRNMMLSIDIIPVAMDEAVSDIRKRIMSVESDITRWQQRQNQNNNFTANIPYDLEQMRSETKEFMDDLMSRDQRMMLALVTLTHLADNLEQLDQDTEALQAIGRARGCQFNILRYQQEDALNTVLPLGLKRIDATRTLTTECTAVLMPFKSQEIQDAGGIYYGVNAVSHNLIICNRSNLLNGNGFITGVSGSGKSMAAKQEMTALALSTDHDIIIVDPEREYGELVRALGGEVITISASDPNGCHINALDLSEGYGDGREPLVMKSEFIMSLYEQLMGADKIEPQEKSIIDRSVGNIYREYLKSYQGQPPTLKDLYDDLMKQVNPEAHRIALALELFTVGSLNVFSHQTNINTKSRILCFDIQDLGENLKSVGLLVMLDAIYNRVIQNRKAGKYTHVYIDEIYLFFANGSGSGHSITNYSSEFLYKCWKRFRKYGATLTGITQNVEECLLSNTARMMFANSEFLLMLNQATTDREQLARLLGASDTQMSYVDNAPAGHGLIKVGGAIVPFANELPKNTELYRLMTTKPGED